MNTSPQEEQAAPPDAASNQGSFNTPEESMHPEQESSGFGPPLHHDAAGERNRRGSLAVFVLLAMFVLGLIALGAVYMP